MPESVLSFQTLPAEYQEVIQLAEDRHGITISPLQELAGGWSGAIIYLIRVASTDSGEVKHLILKLDRKQPKSSSDEIARYKSAQQLSPAGFAKSHIPELAFDRVESGEVLAIFYSIAGQSLRDFRTLSNYQRQKRIETLFSITNHVLLDQWNPNLTFKAIEHPQVLLHLWSGFRLEPGQNIEHFLQEVCQLDPELPGFILEDKILPNPLRYARDREAWGSIRSLDAAFGLQHGDLNTNNILSKFSRFENELEGYYLIDFTLFKERMPLLFDQRYLEMSYLVHSIAPGIFSSVITLIQRYSEHPFLPAEQTPIEMVGINSAVQAGRLAFEEWVNANHPTLHDDLWGQYWLAGAAAGLNYCHKAGLSDEIRLAGLMYSAANLKLFFRHFEIPMPTEASQLQIEGQLEKLARSDFSRTRTAQRVTHNLPAPLTNFVGRTEELKEVSELLLSEGVRSVTLTGPGGTGKTRLAIEIGRSTLDRFQHGTYFVDLAQTTDPALVMSTTAHTLEVREGGGLPPLEKLITYLANKEMLLIFDNFEQVTEAGSDLAQLLAATTGVKALVTSRVPMRIRGEHEYPVPPLELPPDVSPSLKETLGYESVALFQQQAKAVQPNFEITEDNRTTIIEICRRLDGLPLAIELAAARTKMLSPEALMKRLDQSLQVLVGGAKDLPDRQQTLRATIDWSYQLLQPEEQDLFSRLGIFSGGFTLDAAEAICSTMDGMDVYRGIEALLNNSLIRQVQSVTEEPRFDMLQTIREFALEKAAEADMMEELGWAHCSYFSQLAGSGMDGGIYGPESVFWYKRYEEEHDNYRVALTWAAKHPEDSVLLTIIMMTQLTWFWYRYGYLKEGSEWTERALAATEGMGESMARAFALGGRGSLALWSGDLYVAEQLTRESMEMGQRLGLDEVVSVTKMTYGTTLVNQGRDKEAYPHLVDAVELFDDRDQTWMKGTAMVHLANVSLGMGDPEQALNWLDNAMPLLSATGDIWTMAFGLNNYGEVARAQGDYERAEEYYRRTEALYRQADSKGDQARLIHTFGYLALHKGEYEKAKSLFIKSLDEFQKLGNHRGITECLAGMACLAAEQKEYAAAATLLSAAENQLSAFGGAWWPADRVEIERARDAMRFSLSDQFEEHWKQGQSMNVDEAIAYALGGT